MKKSMQWLWMAWLLVALPLSAQNTGDTNLAVNVVNVVVTDESGSEMSPMLPAFDTAAFSIRRSGPATAALPVFFTLTGTAGNGVDYLYVTNYVTIPEGATNVAVVIFPVDDGLYEPSETVTLTLQYTPLSAAYAYYRIGTNAAATVVIRDNDPAPASNHPPVVSFVTPKAAAVFTAPTNIPISVAASDPEGLGTIQQMAIYAGTNRLALFASLPGANSSGTTNALLYSCIWSNPPVGKFPLRAIAVDNQAATGRVEISVTIAAPAELPAVSVVAADPTAREISPLLDVMPDLGLVTFTRSGGTNASLAVYYSVGGTASNGADYAELPFMALIPAGLLQTTVEVSPLDDALAEGAETVVITLRAASTYRLGDQTNAVVTILDDDSPWPALPVVSVRATDPEAAEPNSVQSGMGMPTTVNTGEFAFVRTGPTNEPLDVYFAFWENRTNTTVQTNAAFLSGLAINGVDFAPIASPVTIPAGATSAVVRLIPIDDQLVEGTEYAILGLLLPPSGSSRAYVISTNAPSATVGIVDNDPATTQVVSIQATDAEAAEPNPLAMNPGIANPGQFTVVRQGPTNAALTVSLAVGGTAENGIDYAAIASSVTIPAGAVSATLAVVPLADNLLEGSETVRIEIAIPPMPAVYPPLPLPYFVGSPGSAEVRILDYVAPTSHVPTVSLVAPASGAVFTAPANLGLSAKVADAVDGISRVEFFAGDQRLGAISSPTAVVSFMWSNVMVGEYSLRAQAIDPAGNIGVSSPVRVVVRERTPQAVRQLPAGYAPGQPFQVVLRVVPTSQVRAWALEEVPPAGWPVQSLSEGGSFDPAFGKVKFGPFLDNAVRTLTYVLVPPAEAHGVFPFTGVASFDGTNQPVAGASAVGLRLHPADKDPADWRITMSEVTAFASAWRDTNAIPLTNTASSPGAFPISYVTRAGYLWKSGEYYTLDASAATAPLCWIPLPVTQLASLAAVPASGLDSAESTAFARCGMPTNFAPGMAIQVQLLIKPGSNTLNYAVEDWVPAGWAVGAISEGGVFQPVARKVKWGPFYDALPRTVTYAATPVVSSGAFAFQGIASFDGVDIPVTGRRAIACQGQTAPAAINTIQRNENGQPVFRFLGEAGRTYVLEFSTDLITWSPVRTLTTPDGVITYTDSESMQQTIRYYRVRLLE